jgi:hypothetical protein
MRRLFILLAALAATAAIGATGALAAPPGVTTCGSTDPYTPQQIHGTVDGNLNVPAGTWCVLGWPAVIKGVVTVQGHLKAFGVTFNQNVIVDGGSFKAENGGTTILGNLSIKHSVPFSDPGDAEINGLWGPGNHIAKNLIYQDNFVGFYVGNLGEGQTIVDGNFNASGNPWIYTPSLTVSGQTNVS